MSDYYLVVPLPAEVPEGSLLGAPQVFVVAANDSDEAAALLRNEDFPNSAVLVAEFHEGTT